MKRFLQFVPRALALWPQVGPTSGKHSLPKREGFVGRSSGSSFASDVLGPMLRQQSRPTQNQESQDSSTLAPALLPSQQSELPAHRQVDVERHTWRWQVGRWLCTQCLASSRGAVPSRIYGCKGMAPNLADLLQRPRKHVLQIATFSSGAGVVVICSRCGHYATTNRPCKLHKQACKNGFESQGARTAYERVSMGLHPRHAQGDTKVLDPCVAASALAQTNALNEAPP